MCCQVVVLLAGSNNISSIAVAALAPGCLASTVGLCFDGADLLMLAAQ
jgi:hypothetical protein